MNDLLENVHAASYQPRVDVSTFSFLRLDEAAKTIGAIMVDYDAPTLALRLKSITADGVWTQNMLAEAAGVSGQAVSKWMKGGDAKDEHLTAIADKANVDFWRLKLGDRVIRKLVVDYAHIVGNVGKNDTGRNAVVRTTYGGNIDPARKLFAEITPDELAALEEIRRCTSGVETTNDSKASRADDAGAVRKGDSSRRNR